MENNMEEKKMERMLEKMAEMEKKMQKMEEAKKAVKEKSKKIIKGVCMVGWIIPLLLLALISGGRALLNRLGLSGGAHHEARTEETSIAAINYNLGAEINQALDEAHKEAEAYADGELDIWIGEVLARMDREFMDDYFDVLNTYGREAKAILLWLPGELGLSESPETVMTRELEEMVSKKIIRPEVSQSHIKNITDAAINVYTSCLDEELQKIQQAHRIPTPDWNRYICEITGMTMDVESRTYPVSTKAFLVSGGAIAIASAPALVNVAKSVLSKIAEKTGIKLVEKAGAKAAIKTGGKTVAKAIPIIGWGVTAAIVIWDIADHKGSADKAKAMLKENMRDYMAEVKREMLGSTANSIMGALTDWENKVKRSIMEMK
ncbi:MAG: hypothetical protein K6G18_03255 [Treponema sp.]|nr:hypothetical protein [Treponema sp.]